MTSTDNTEARRHFIGALYDTLDRVVSPTPALEITEGDRVDVRFLNGKGRLPTPNSTEATVLDLNIASLFFDDFSLLYEGPTGTGKTYTSDALFGTVFGPDGHYPLRLSGGILGNSALEPFTQTISEGGMPKTRIDHDKCSKYGALFIDEINRGDSQEVFQVVDGKIHVNGDTGYLGIPIPGTKRRKRLAIIAAMNPADAQHSDANELDIAGENRFLKFRFPNGVTEAGSSQLEKIADGEFHEQFWAEFAKRSGRSNRWKEEYPLITDPSQFAYTLDGQTREFIDVALGYVGADPKETFGRNAELMEQVGIKPAFAVPETNDYKQIITAQGALKHGFVRRDLTKIQNLSRLLAFVKGVKSGTYDTRVGLNDSVASIGVVLESKVVTGTEQGSLMTLVNDARKAYHELHGALGIPQGYGLRQAVWQAAVHAGIEAGEDQAFDMYLNTIKAGIGQLNTQTQKPAQATIKSRLVADLGVLLHFSGAHEAEIKAALRNGGDDAFNALYDVYDKGRTAASVYEHRLGSIMR